MQKTHEAFGHHVKSLRKGRQMTQRVLAESCGLRFTEVSMIEAGYLMPGKPCLQRMAKVLECSYSELVRGED